MMLEHKVHLIVSSTAARRVRQDFNPSSSGIVHDIKMLAAALITAIENIEAPTDTISPEVARLKSLATTAAEEAAMWGVKAATA